MSAKLTDEVENGTMWASSPTAQEKRRGGHWPPASTTGTVPVVENIYGTHRRLYHTFEQDISRVMENCTALSEQTWNVTRLHTLEVFYRRAREALKPIVNLIQDR